MVLCGAHCWLAVIFAGPTQACHFLCLETKKVTKESSRKKRLPRVSFLGLRYGLSYSVASAFVFHAYSCGTNKENRRLNLVIVFWDSPTNQHHQGPTALHHSSTKAKLKYPPKRGCNPFRMPFFGYLFWASKKGKKEKPKTFGGSATRSMRDPGDAEINSA